MENIEMKLGGTYQKDSTTVQFSAEFKDPAKALGFLNELNHLVIEFNEGEEGE